MEMIRATRDLEDLCSRASDCAFVTIDTEFMRERTYWPDLCLVQLATPEEAHVIDALADRIDLSPLFGLLNDSPTLKVLHSARQDLEIFFHLTGRVPERIFDTQIAAMVCGYKDSIGYERLVRDIARRTLDKSMQRTNWAARPLGRKQIAYALADVTHLRAIYRELSDRLDRAGRATWLSEEIAILTDPATYRPDPENAWKRIRFRHRKPESLAMLKALAEWREIAAQTRNVPRNWILKDETLADIAASRDRSANELSKLRSVTRERDWRMHKNDVQAVVDRVRNMDPSHYPTLPPERGEGQEQPPTELMRALLSLKCAHYGVAQKLVATASDLERIAGDDSADVPALHGWRREVFGHDALRLKRGEIAIKMRGQSMEVVDTLPGHGQVDR